MKVHTEKQGSQEWLDLREGYNTASELPNVMGVGFMKRDTFVKNTALGIKEEPNAFMKKKFQEGHDAEAAARPLLKEMLGEEFKSVVGTLEDEALLASLDGINEAGTIIWEHKVWNKTLPDKVMGGVIPPRYEWQLEQQLYVSGAKKAIFMCSDGTKDKMVWCEYTPKRGRVKRLQAAWKEFHDDVRDYIGQPSSPKTAKPEKERPPEVVVEREKRDTLPAIKFSMVGMTLRSNLDGYIIAANELVAKSQILIETDDDFANCEKATKQLKKAEDYIKQVKADVLSEVTSIDEFNKALDTISGSIREARLNGENQVKSRKEEIRREIIGDSQQKLEAYIEERNRGLGNFRVPSPVTSFSIAIKGKKTIESLKQAASEHLEEAIDTVNDSTNTIIDNSMSYDINAEGYEALFPDLGNLISLESSLFETMVKGRVADFKLDELEKKAAQEKLDKEELDKAALVEPEPEPVPAQNHPMDDSMRSAGDILKDMPISQPKEVSFEDMEVEQTTPNQARLEHRQKVHIAIKETMKAYGLDDELATTLVKAMSAGEIPRIQIDYS